MLKFRLAKCCYCLNLRYGCFLVAFLDLCLHLAQVDNASKRVHNIGEHLIKANSSTDQILGFVSPYVYPAHFLGCLMLFLSAAVEMSPLVLVYLTTDIIKIMGLIVAVHGSLSDLNTIIAIIIFCTNMIASTYFWLVAYSYFLLCREKVAET